MRLEREEDLCCLGEVLDPRIGAVGLGEREHDELLCADVDEPSDHVGESIP